MNPSAWSTETRHDTSTAETWLLRAERVSKRYSRELDRSLRFGVRAIFDDLLGLQRSDAPLRPSEFWAVEEISLIAGPGDSLGIVGRNGAGKSTLMRMLAGITRPDRGRIIRRGRVGTLLEPSAGMNPTLSGRENAQIALALGGVHDPDGDRLDELIDFAGIGDVIDEPVRSYSAGMQMRLGFSAQIHVEPQLLLIDEALVVGDASFQRRCLVELQRLLNGGAAVIFVTHSLTLFRTLATTAIYLEEGLAVERGDPSVVAQRYLHDLVALEGGAADVHDVLSREGGDLLDSTTPGPDEQGGSDEDANAPMGDLERPVVATRVAVVSVHGGELHSGEPARLSVQVDASRAVNDCLVAMTIWTPDQLVCPVYLMNDRSEPIELGTGASRVECSVPSLRLGPGQYALRCGIIDASTMEVMMLFGYDGHSHYFEVRQGRGHAPPPHGGDPLSILPVEWSTVG